MIELPIQVLALVAALALPAVAPRVGRVLHRKILALCARLGRSPKAFVALCAALAALLSASVATFANWPEPSIHDEFSYLLAADTFAQGRASYPTHPLWEHFESYHILQRPSYASKYPPAQGLSLGLGIALSGEAALGLWLQAAAMCGAVAWMLLGWLPARWAVLGSLLMLLRIGVASDWSQSYWGGAVAATGGALVFGALPRIMRQPRVGLAITLGIGLAILANSRPYGGFVACVPAAIVLLVWIARSFPRPELRITSRLLLPLLAITAVTVGSMAYYNWRITGDPLVLPYTEYDRQYAYYPAFLWDSMHPMPVFRHDAIEEFTTGYAKGDYGAGSDPAEFTGLALARSYELLSFFVGPVLLVPFLAAFALRRPRAASNDTGFTSAGGARLAAITCLVVVLALCGTSFVNPHYAAPVAGLVMLLVGEGWRRIYGMARASRQSRPEALLAGIVLATLLTTALQIWKVSLRDPTNFFGHYRAESRDRLLDTPGRDLVVVCYTEGHSPHQEWVYNEGDIDAAEIVWARDMGEEKNLRLYRHYPDRVWWMLRHGHELDLKKTGRTSCVSSPP